MQCDPVLSANLRGFPDVLCQSFILSQVLSIPSSLKKVIESKED